MSTARDLLLEIKRQLGKVNAVEPDETDVFAFLNRALAGIWNYGARLNSPVLLKHEVFTSESGTVNIPGGAMRVQSVREHGRGAMLPNATLDYAAASGRRCYVAYPDRIEVYPLNEPAVVDVVYLPSFSRLMDRADELPFPPEMDNAVIALAVGIMSGRYFRPSGAGCVTCCGPW